MARRVYDAGTFVRVPAEMFTKAHHVTARPAVADACSTDRISLLQTGASNASDGSNAHFGHVSIYGVFAPDENAAKIYADAKAYLSQNATMRKIFAQLENGRIGGDVGWRTHVHVSEDGPSQFTPLLGKQLLVNWHPRQALMPRSGKGISPYSLLAHEFFHAVHYASDAKAYIVRARTPAGFMLNGEEAVTVARERLLVNALNEGARLHYFDAAMHYVDAPNLSISAQDAPWLVDQAKTNAIIQPELRFFPKTYRLRILRKLQKSVGTLRAELRPLALRELRIKERRLLEYAKKDALPDDIREFKLRLTLG